MEDFGQLDKIFSEIINQSIEAKTLNVNEFIRQMEAGFKSCGFREPPANGILKNILIIRLDAVGDYILTSAAIRTIRENFPSAHITFVVSENLYPLAELCPYVNEVFAIDQDQNFSPQLLVDLANFARQNLWRRHFDLSFYLGLVMRPVRNFLSYLSGARERICFDVDEASKYFHTKCIQILPEYYEHECLMNLHLLRQAGLKIGDTRLEIWFERADLIAAERLMGNFAPNRIKISVGIGANHAARKYPVEKYLIAFSEIISKGASIIILGGPAEVDDAKFLEDNLPAEFVKNVVPIKTGWRIDAALMSLTDLYIGNMTGACDVAAALKLPIVTLSRVAKDITEFFKIHNEAKSYRPWQTKSIVLQPDHQLDDCRAQPSYLGCRANTAHCIAQITPQEIVDAYEKMLEFIRR